MSTELESSFEHRVVVLGNDAQLFARPATPVQLAQACLAAGYTFVAPASWGDELIAMHAIEAVAQGPAAVSVLCQCPFVAESLRALPEMLHPVWTAVSPPVAVARYLRAAFAPHQLHITYVGNCPGAAAADIDARFLPENFIAGLIDMGIIPVAQPTVYQSMVPPDRSRFASLPGGIPHADELERRAEAELHEVVPLTLEAVARVCPPNARTLLALSRGSGCVCARDRAKLAALEPPRSLSPVVDEGIPVALVPVVASERVTAATHQPDLSVTGEEFAPEPPLADMGMTGDEPSTPSPLASGVITTEERDAMSSAGYSAYWALPEATEPDSPKALESGKELASTGFSDAADAIAAHLRGWPPDGGGEGQGTGMGSAAESEQRASPATEMPKGPSAAPEGETELGDPEAYPTYEPPSGEQEHRQSDARALGPQPSAPQADFSNPTQGDRPWHGRLGRIASRPASSGVSLGPRHEHLPHLVDDRSRRRVGRHLSEAWWSLEWRRTLGLLALGMAGVFASIGRAAPALVGEGSEDRAPRR